MNRNPLLSICIPTHNRSSVLKNVLEHYVNNLEFDQDVELIVSDNASTDDTEKVCLEYSKILPNLKYFKNSYNVYDLNFVKVLDRATGDYLKLCNDWVFCTDESLRYLKDRIRENRNDNIPLFFTSDTVFTRFKAPVIECNNLDDYVKVISTYVTFNNNFGVWRNQWEQVKDKQAYSDLKLQQVDWSYQIVRNYGKCIIYDKKIFELTSLSVGVRCGYNWFQIHLDNYYKIMMPYILDNRISQETYSQDKRNLLYHFKEELALSLFYNYSKNWKYETEGTLKLFLKYYKYDYFFFIYLIYIIFFDVYKIVRICLGKLKRLIFS